MMTTFAWTGADIFTDAFHRGIAARARKEPGGLAEALKYQS
jgi:hypothetical protein